MRCVRRAAEELAVLYTVHDLYGNLISIDTQKKIYFANYSTPFNSDSIHRICKDKEFTAKLVGEVIQTPRTHSFFDPFPKAEENKCYIKEKSYEEIAERILSEFSLPVIVKMNSGRQGANVFLAHTSEEVLSSIKEIFNHTSQHYDYIALAQEYVERAQEFRVVVFKGEIVLVYEKDFSGATFSGNLSPLHYENAVAHHVNDPVLIQALTKFIQPLQQVVGVEFAGLDVILNTKGEMYLVEINSQPGFGIYIRDNGEEEIVSLYKKLIQSLLPPLV